MVKFTVHCHFEKEGVFGRGWLSLYRQKRTYQAIYFYYAVYLPANSGYLHFPSWFDHFFDCIVTYHHVRLQSRTYLYYVFVKLRNPKKEML